MSNNNVYLEKISKDEDLMRLMKDNILPQLYQNITDNMPTFVNTFKEIRSLQIERQNELEKWKLIQDYNLEKFKLLVNETNKRLSSQVNSITTLCNSIINLHPKTQEEIRSQELMLSALQSLQQTYLSEIQMLINI